MNPRWHLRALRVAVLALGPGLCSLAHAAGPNPPNLTQLTNKAGFIFAGRVLRVDRPAVVPGRVPLVRVTLLVERALRGVQRGETFRFTEWAGAWDSRPQYRPGQRLFLFLYPRSSTGLTSVVGGRLGQFDLDPAGNIVLRGDQEQLLLTPEVESSAPARTRRPLPAKFRYGDFAGRIRRAQGYEP